MARSLEVPWRWGILGERRFRTPISSREVAKGHPGGHTAGGLSECCGSAIENPPLRSAPPVSLTLDVLPRAITEVGGADDEDLEALRSGLVASPRTGRDTHRVPFLEFEDLVVELDPSASAHDHVHLLLLLVRVAVRKTVIGRDALIAESGTLELECLGCEAELQVRRAVEVGPHILHVLLEIP